VASSVFGRIRFGLDSLLAEQRVLALGGDSVTRDLRHRARGASGRTVDALLAVGPRRMLEEVALADSLLALAGAREPTSALPAFERARLGEHLGFILMAARQFFPDSAWLPPPAPALETALTHANVAVSRAPWSADVWLARSSVYRWLYSETEITSWRDSALVDLQKATSLAGTRPDVWSARAGVEIQAGRWREALYSAERGQEHDHLFVNAQELRYRKALAEMMLQDFTAAQASCRSGANDFPGSDYFITCEAEVLGRSSSDSGDAGRLLALADSLDAVDAPLPPMVQAELRLFAAAVLARAGRGDSADRIFGGVVDTWGARVDPVLLLDAVYVRDVMGDVDSALALAARAVREDPTAALGMERLPWFQRLRGYPGFAAALRGMSPAEVLRR
jgi:tetratricopeptide (TPR) repeat protein